MKLPKTRAFLYKYCYPPLPILIDDGQPIMCNFCKNKGWLPENIKHKKECELLSVLNEIDKVEAK